MKSKNRIVKRQTGRIMAVAIVAGLALAGFIAPAGAANEVVPVIGQQITPSAPPIVVGRYDSSACTAVSQGATSGGNVISIHKLLIPPSGGSIELYLRPSATARPAGGAEVSAWLAKADGNALRAGTQVLMTPTGSSGRLVQATGGQGPTLPPVKNPDNPAGSSPASTTLDGDRVLVLSFGPCVGFYDLEFKLGEIPKPGIEGVKGTTKATIVVAKKKLVQGKTVKVTVKVTTASKKKVTTGKVRLTWPKNTKTVKVKNGQAIFKIKGLKPGKRTIKATYLGTKTLAKAKAKVVKLTIKKR